MQRVDVAIIGAGSAGLSALAEVRKVTKEYVVIDGGPLGTTCARVGCMPSKALIQLANEYHHRRHLKGRGISGGKAIRLNIPQALASVRRLRNSFTEEVIRSTEQLGNHLIRGQALFIGPNELRVGKKEFFAKRVILATGSQAVIPKEFQNLAARIITTDSLFELTDLPKRVGILGLGPVGLEIGQAISRLGCHVIAFDRSQGVGALTDPAINSYASRHFAKEFPIHFKSEVKLKTQSNKINILAAGRVYESDLIFASLGRRPNLGSIGLEQIGITLNKSGHPHFDRETMKIRGFPIFLAGDSSAKRDTLHEASDDGRIAGYNSVHPISHGFKRRAPLAITFSDPNLAMVGKNFAELKKGSFVTGKASFETQGRSLIMGENYGLLHVYARAGNGEFLGAEMIGPEGEHIAHLMAWALQQKLTVFEMLRMPFYHPVVEEGLRSALRDAARKTNSRVQNLEIPFTH